MAELLEGHGSVDDGVRLEARDFELAIAAVLLHDAGYLKLKSDTAGTGAKYTFCHILRSCAFAASYLPGVGVNDAEIDGVISAINCTGPNSEISRLRFREPGRDGRGVRPGDGRLPRTAGRSPATRRNSESCSASSRNRTISANVPPERRLFKSPRRSALPNAGFLDPSLSARSLSEISGRLSLPCPARPDRPKRLSGRRSRLIWRGFREGLTA